MHYNTNIYLHLWGKSSPPSVSGKFLLLHSWFSPHSGHLCFVTCTTFLASSVISATNMLVSLSKKKISQRKLSFIFVLPQASLLLSLPPFSYPLHNTWSAAAAQLPLTFLPLTSAHLSSALQIIPTSWLQHLASATTSSALKLALLLMVFLLVLALTQRSLTYGSCTRI